MILPRLAGPLGPVLLAAARGDLGPVVRSVGAGTGELPTLPGAAVGIVLAAAGYPGSPRRGDRIDGLDAAARRGGLVFHAGTERDPAGGFRTAGGRVLTVVGRGPGLETARRVAEDAADEIHWAGLQRRHDIAAASAAAPVAPSGGQP